MADDEKKSSSGCGLMVLYNGIFRRHSSVPRRSASAGSLPNSPTSNSKCRRGGSSDEAVLIAAAASVELPQKFPPVPASRGQTRSYQQQQQQQFHKPVVRSKPAVVAPPPQNNGIGRGISGELDSVIYDHQREKGSNTLVRASSSNVMLFGDLGNLRAGGGGAAMSPNRNVLDYLPKTAKEMGNGMQGNATRGGGGGIGNVGKGNARELPPPPAAEPSFCRALSRRLDPEELKEMGNEEYKKGRFAEALALYDRAITLDPGRAAYWSNKAAALTGLGRLLEAVAECREAVKIEPSYRRAHHRIATLYLRLGEAEKALRHYKLSGNEATTKDMAQTKSSQNHIDKCNEARMLKDWSTVQKEAQLAISFGADSAPLVFASKAEALLKLQRHQDADAVLIDAPTFDTNESTKFFGAAGSAYVLAVRAQVDMAAGRFDESVSVAQKAARIDPNSKEVAAVARRTRAVLSARAKGNDLFKAAKFAEACIAYTEGLDHDPHNSVLLCNRAACRMKLDQWEKAVEDCSVALNMRPSYNKARLRRADCNTKLEKWEASLQDYEVLIQEMSGDEGVQKALCEVQIQLKKQRGEYVNGGC